MPRFYQDVDIEIEPFEFLEKCSPSELHELYDALQEDYGMGELGSGTEDVRSEGHRIFLRNLHQLKESWISISREDAEIINILAKKYGGV